MARSVWTAPLVTALPNHETSWPTPATVSQAESSEPTPISIKHGQEQTGDPKAFPTPHDNLQNTMVEANQENDRVWCQPMTNGSLSAACANT